MKENETKTQTNNKPAKGKSVVKTILNTIVNILIILVLITSVLIAVLSLTSKSNNGVATIFGYSFHTIQTPSMEGGNPKYEGGDYHVGDLVIGKEKGAADRDYKEGDIIAYRTENDEGQTVLICHRIIDVADQDGTKSYQTMGDANDAPDQYEIADYLYSYDIASLCYDDDYHGAVLRGWGAPLDYIREPQGFFFVVLLPMIIFFMYEIIRVVMNAMNYKKSKEEEAKEDAQKERDEAVKAAVAAALAAKDSETPAEAPAAEAQEKAEENAENTTEKKTEDTPAAPPEMSAEELEQFRQFQEFQKMQKAQQEAENNTSEEK